MIDMNTLPIEVLGKILNHLDVKDRCSAVLVSKAFYEAGCLTYNLEDINVTFDKKCLSNKRVTSFSNVLELIASSRRIVNITFDSFPIGNQPSIIADPQPCNLLLQRDSSLQPSIIAGPRPRIFTLPNTSSTSPRYNSSSPPSLPNPQSRSDDYVASLATVDRFDYLFYSRKKHAMIGGSNCDSTYYDGAVISDATNKIGNAKLRNKIYNCETDYYFSRNEPRVSKEFLSLNSLSKIRSLTINEDCSDGSTKFDWNNLVTMLQRCVLLQDLTLSKCDGVFDSRLSDLDAADVSCSCENENFPANSASSTLNRKLRRVEADSCACGNSAKALSSLKRLTLDLRGFGSNDHLDVILRNAPKLRALTVSGLRANELFKMSVDHVIGRVCLRACQLTALHLYNIVEDSHIERLTSCKDLNLEEVSFTFPKKISDKGVINLVSNQRNIKMLNLKGCDNLTDYSLAAIKKFLSNLKELNLAYSKVAGGPVSNFYPPGKAILANETPRLKKLSLMCCDVTNSDIWMRDLKSSLTMIDLSGCQVNDDWFSVFPSWLPNLHELYLNNTKISSKGIKSIFTNLQHLRVLSLARCQLVTDDMLLGVESTIDLIENDSASTQNDFNNCIQDNIQAQAINHVADVDSYITTTSNIFESNCVSIASLNKLRKLDISYCSQITDACLTLLTKLEDFKVLIYNQ